MTITKVELLERDGTHVRDLTGWLTESTVGFEEVNEFGGGSIAMEYDHADVAHMTAGRLVRYTLDSGHRLSWMLGRPRRQRISRDGESGRVYSWSGKGALAVLGTGRQGGGVSYGDADGPRKTFGWITKDWDDSAWTEPTSRGLAQTRLPNDIDWPDDTAEWLGSDVGGNATYLRRWLDVPARPPKVGAVRVFAAGKGDWTLWIDGEKKLSGSNNEAGSFDFTIDAAGHQVAMKTSTGPGLFTMVQVNDDGTLGNVVYRSFTQGVFGTGDPDPWVGKEAGSTPAKVNFGYCADKLLTAAQTRGAIPGVTWTFDGTGDSNAASWTTQFEIYTVRAQELYGDLMLRMAQDFNADVRMLADLELGGYDSLGEDLSATVLLTDEADDPEPSTAFVADAMVDGQPVLGTVIRLQTDGGFGDVEDATAVAAHGRIEVPVTIGTASSVGEIEAGVTNLLARLLPMEVQHLESDGPSAILPWSAFDLGDNVGVRREWGGVMVSHRMMRIGFTPLPSGQLLYAMRAEVFT